MVKYVQVKKANGKIGLGNINQIVNNVQVKTVNGKICLGKKCKW